MKDINLFKKKVKFKNKYFLLFNITIVLLLIALVFVSGLSYLLLKSKTNLLLKLNDLESINLELKAYSDKLQAYKKFEADVEYKSELIKKLQSSNITWSEKFYKISSIIPDGIYLNSFNGAADNIYNAINAAESGTEPGNIKLTAFTINGYASDYIEISKLLIGFKDIPEIIDPWVISINENIVNNMKLLNFTVEAYWDLPLFLKDIKIVKPQEQKINTESDLNLNPG